MVDSLKSLHLRKHAPTVIEVGALAGSVAYWLVTYDHHGN